MIVVLMGVTATGKTSIAHELVRRTGWAFAEGDDYHSKENVAKMHAGTPLTDQDRAPWLAALHGVLAGWVRDEQNGVMTCSALKQQYRNVLQAGLPSGSVTFVVLKAPKAVLQDRLAHRPNHYMNPRLLDSQMATLEDPEDAIHLDVSGTVTHSTEVLLRTLAVTPHSI